MPSFEEFAELPADFVGPVRLFPLPNLVLFPHVVQPLHIFEARYRALLESALDSDGLIAMAVLAPGWESTYEGRPTLFPYACLGQISTHCRLEDGTYNLLLLGMHRVRLLDELPPTQPFREAKIEICQDVCPPNEAALRAELQRRMRKALMHIVPAVPEAQEQLEQLLGGEITLGALSDVIAYMLDISVADKQALLGELSVARRAESVLHHLGNAAVDHSATSGSDRFPPEFSVN